MAAQRRRVRRACVIGALAMLMHVRGNIMRTRLFTLFSILALGLSVAACADVADDPEEAELDEGSDDSKTDQPDIALTAVEFDAPIDIQEPKVGVIKSKTAWKQVFGVAAPSSIDFNKDWVAY
jgi:hypothetical protein